MVNPYYVAPQTNMLGDALNSVFKMTSLDQSAQQLVEMKRRTDLEAQQANALYGNPATPDVPGLRQQELAVHQGTLAVHQNQNELARQKFISTNPQADDWNSANFSRLDSKLRLAGVPVDDIPFMSELKTFSQDPTMKKGDVYQAVSMRWPEWRKQTAESLGEKISKLSDQAANLPDGDPKKKELLGQINKYTQSVDVMEKIPADNIKQLFFPDIHQYEQNQRSALQASRLAYLQEMGKPERQYVAARKSLYVGQGLDEDTATVKAVEDLYTQEARKVKEGRIVMPRPERLVPVDDGQGNIIYVPQSEASGRKVGKPGVNREASARDKKIMADLISSATKQGTIDPSSSDIEVIKSMAEPLGYDFRQVTKTTPGKLYGTNETKTWDLVPAGKPGEGGSKGFTFINGKLVPNK